MAPQRRALLLALPAARPDALWVCLALKGGPGAARQRNREAERALLTFLSPQLAQGCPCPSAPQAKPAQSREQELSRA